MNNLQIGTHGWSHPDWRGSFYPEEMPQEWELDFYNNAFHVVLVPAREWQCWQEEELRDCVDAVDEEFRFYLQVDEPLTEDLIAKLEAVKQEMGDLLGGLVVFSDEWKPEARIAGLPVSLVSGEIRLPGWSFESEGRTLSGAPFGYIRELSADGKWQAGMLRTFMQSLPDNLQGAPFFIGGESINMAQVANLKVVGEVLGY